MNVGEWEYTVAELADQLARAEARKVEREARGEVEPAATAVRYDQAGRKFTVELANGTASSSRPTSARRCAARATTTWPPSN